LKRVAVLTLVVAGLAAVPAHATFPGPNGRIAFSDGNPGEIYTINPDGSGLEQVTDFGDGRGAGAPHWSPDGTRMVFTVRRTGTADDHARIWIVRADGSDAHQVATAPKGFGDRAPTYTPDGRHIVFFRSTPFFQDGSAIWKMRINGTHQRALTPFSGDPNPTVDESPSVSPDGGQITFVRYFADGIGARVFVMRIDGSNLHRISPLRFEASVPDWSPDGQRITFTSNGNHFFGSAAYTMRPNGTDIQRVTPDRYPHNDEGASYSPQGDQIIFGSDRDYPDFCCLDLFSISPSGAGEQAVFTGSSSLSYPAWGTAPLIP
jgi:TolB protein